MSLTWQHMLDAAPGLTYRQLFYWSRKGWLHPDNPGCGSGHTLHWPDSEARTANIMLRLIASGYSPAGAARIAAHRPDNQPEPARPRPVAAARLDPNIAHSYTTRGGRYYLDGHDITGEHPIYTPSRAAG